MFDAARVPVLTGGAIGDPSPFAGGVRPLWRSRGTEVHATARRSQNGSAAPGLLLSPEVVHR